MIHPEFILKIVGDLLRDDAMPEYVDSAALHRLLAKSLELAAIGTSEPPPAVYPMMLTRFINRMVATDRLIRVRRDLYANVQHSPRPHPNTAAGQISPGAIISVHTVLGESGVANNPSRITYAVVPEDALVGRSREMRVHAFGEFRFIGMARTVVEAGSDADRLDMRWRYLRATTERAICDWVYFATRGRSSGLCMPAWDLDFDGIDRDRLQRLSSAMGVERALDAWLEHKAVVDTDVEASEQVSLALDF